LNDNIFLSIVMIGLGLWASVYVVEYALKGWRWFKQRMDIEELIDTGDVPADYGVIEREQERLNKIDEGNLDPTHEATREIRVAVHAARQKVAHVRFAGFKIGEQDQHAGTSFARGVISGPFKKGSGEAKQWVRGYCMARNVLDIKQYYRDA